MSKTFLFIDHNSLWIDPTAENKTLSPMIEILFWQGVKKLLHIRTYYLHQTMGRPIIMRLRHNTKLQEVTK